MKIYKILDLKNSQGKWLEEYEVPENFPVENGWTTVAPDSSLHFPKWDYGLRIRTASLTVLNSKMAN